MEDYIRHTLQDLKTLTRGLAARPPPVARRRRVEGRPGAAPDAAQVELDWTFNIDHDLVLNVVQWSALTRVLRELVSNAIAHARPRAWKSRAALEGGRCA